MPNITNYRLLHKRFVRFKRIISDWDDTVTSKDTIPLLFDAIPKATTRNESIDSYGLDYFFNIYMDKYNDYINNQLPGKPYKSRNCIENEILYQKDMKNVERSSVIACQDLLVFKGVSRQSFMDQADNVRIKSGFSKFYQYLISENQSNNLQGELNIQFVILSVNWTGLIISECLKRLAKSVKGVTSSDATTPVVVSNEFEFDENGNCTGKLFDTRYTDIRTGYDKLIQCKRIINDEIFNETLYIGDSATDVLSMVYCKFGVIMKGGKASETLRRLGYKVYHIDQCIKETEIEDVKFLEVDDWFDLFYIYNPNLFKL